MKHKIKNIEDLRDVALQTLEDLRTNKITPEEAGASGKLCESVISSIKLEIEYSKLNSRVPKIDFLGDLKGKIIEHEPNGKSQKLLK